jgi:hypothetical protein
MPSRLRILLPWLAIFTVLSGAASAQSPADVLIERGIDLRVQHKDREALEQFKKAYDVQATPRALAQIGLAEQALGSWADAEKHLSEALKSSDPWILKNHDLLAESLRVVGAHLGSLEIESSVPGAELFVNGVKVSGLPLSAPVRLDAGTAVIEVRKRGYVTVKRPVDISAGAVAPERVVLVQEAVVPQASALAAAVPSSAAPSPVASPPRAATPVAAYVLGGVGIAGFVVAGTFGALALSKKGQLSSDCVDGHLCGSPADSDANKAAHRDALIADVGAAVGVVGLGVGVWMALASPKAPEKVERSAVWQPWVGPGMAGLGCKGTF